MSTSKEKVAKLGVMAEMLVTKETRAIAREMHDEGVPHGIIKLCMLKAGFDRKQSLAVIRALPSESSAEAIAKYNAGKLGGEGATL